MPYFPPTEKQYLTTDGEIIDRLCWNYYGFVKGTVESVYKRNPWLSVLPPILPNGVLVTLPVISRNLLLDKVELWNYTKTLKDGQSKTPTISNLNSIPMPNVTQKDDCCSQVDPPIVENPEWITVWYMKDGKFRLGRTKRENLTVGYGGVPYVTSGSNEIGGDDLASIF